MGHLLSLSERPSNGQRWRTQGHQSGCHLSFPGAHCPPGWCKSTLDSVYISITLDMISSRPSDLHHFLSYFSLTCFRPSFLPLLCFLFLLHFFQISSLSSFADVSAALRVLSPENRTAMPRESFRAFSKIVCGHHELDGERIPSLNWYEDNDIKSFLGKNGTEDVNVEHNNNTSKTLCSFCGRMLMAICADKTWLEALILLYFRVHLHHLNQHNPTEKHLCCLTIVLLGGFFASCSSLL